MNWECCLWGYRAINSNKLTLRLTHDIDVRRSWSKDYILQLKPKTNSKVDHTHTHKGNSVQSTSLATSFALYHPNCCHYTQPLPHPGLTHYCLYSNPPAAPSLVLSYSLHHWYFHLCNSSPLLCITALILGFWPLCFGRSSF